MSMSFHRPGLASMLSLSRSRLVALALSCVAGGAWAGPEFDRVGRLTELQEEQSNVTDAGDEPDDMDEAEETV